MYGRLTRTSNCFNSHKLQMHDLPQCTFKASRRPSYEKHEITPAAPQHTASGRRIVTILNTAGICIKTESSPIELHDSPTISWDGRDSHNRPAQAGIYYAIIDDIFENRSIQREPIILTKD
ncbi:MAG: hypothetical protein GF398_19850 [Chitinivibrionales bacterium]|nr:hypothetical protein [Chitinivibrionales bacterium]